MQYNIGTTSRLGNRNSNQDRIEVIESANALLLVLADGMGGYAGGQLAADIVAKTAVRIFDASPEPILEPQRFLTDLIKIMHGSILEEAAILSPPQEPKTTCVICLIQNGEATWAHVGDSRLYIIRDEAIVEQTTDHSQVEQMYQNGQISQAEKASHPLRNRVTQCLGSKKRTPIPAVSETTSLSSGDLVMLCSDGLWGQIEPQDLKGGFTEQNLNDCLSNLAHAAESNVYPRSDNISAVAMRWHSNSQVIGDEFSEKDIADLLETFDEINQAVEEVKKTA